MAGGDLSIVLVTVDGNERVFPISVQRARDLFRENRTALRYEGWPEGAFDAEERGAVRELLIKYFASSLRLYPRRSGPDAEAQHRDVMLWMSDDARGAAWAIPARNVIALAVVDPEASGGLGFRFGFDSGEVSPK
jgi:hypothetical protein